MLPVKPGVTSLAEWTAFKQGFELFLELSKTLGLDPKSRLTLEYFQDGSGDEEDVTYTVLIKDSRAEIFSAITNANLDKAMSAGFGLLGVLDSITGSNFVKVFGGAIGLLSTKGGGSFSSSTKAGTGGYPSSALGPGLIDPNDAARKKAEADAAKRAKELAGLTKKNLDTQKKSLALQKASKTLNIEAINIEAALKGKISETDRISLLLQKAILEGNATLATSLSDQLNTAMKRNNELRLALLATPEAPNPFRNWSMRSE